MENITRLFMSDLHMCSSDAIAPAGSKHAWGWLSKDGAARAGNFLRSKIVTDCQQLVLVGDVIDRWICPHDVRPPTAREVLDAPHNKPVVEAIRAFARLPGRSVIWCIGNHDAETIPDDARHLADGVQLVSSHKVFPLHARHGHEDCLFNAPDPKGRLFPLGYYISRFVATAAACGAGAVGLNIRTLWNVPDLAKRLLTEPLAKLVFDVVRDRAGLKPQDQVIMPDGQKVALSELRTRYENLIDEWKHHWTVPMNKAVLCESDPSCTISADPHLHILGHTHDAKVDSDLAYINVGSWCDKDAYFAKTWLESPGQDNEILSGALFQWKNGVATQIGDTVTRWTTPVPETEAA